MKNKKQLLIAILALFITCQISRAQENILQHNIHYSAYDQNMWGPDDSYGIDVEHTFFDLSIDENWGFSEITEIFGQEFGIGFQTGILAYLRSTFEAHGFNTGSFDLDYPVEITLDFPNDDSFNYGGPATIHTSYLVTDGWDLSTSFPPVGVTTLDLEYEFNPFMDIIFCVFGCDTIHLIPSDIQVPHTLDTLFHINGETGYTVYPCFEGGDFQFCHDYDLPIEIGDWFDIGITAFVTLPFVETEDYIQEETNCLIASGDSLYMNVNIDIFHFLHSVAGLIPPPEGESIQNALEFLEDTISYGIETPIGDINALIYYELIGADFDTYNYMHQDIEFCPTIWANLSFPLELPYQITDPANGDFLYAEGTEDTIAVPVGHDLTITYPCHDWDEMYIGVEYDISPTIRNHTWDSIAFVVSIDALTVSIEIETPFKNAIEPATLPSFTLPSIENNHQEIIYVTSDEIQSPGVTPYNESKSDNAKNLGPWDIGPLFSWEIPVGHTDLTWFDETWEMENFIQDTVFPGTYIKPYDKSELQMNLYTPLGSYCYGDTANYIYGQVNDNIAPITYYWSTGEVHPGIMNSIDSIFVEPGYYAVTVSDDYGCTSSDDISIQINPPIFNNMVIDDILCHGENTGAVTASTSGGSYPFYYDWSYIYASDGLNDSIAINLPTGWHYLTITDWAGCTHHDSAFISEPPTALELDFESFPVDCFGGDNGIIDINIHGATPPYNINWENENLNGTHVEDLNGGVYTVSITDAHNCLLEESIHVIQPDTLIAHAYGNMIDCYNASNGNIAIHPVGGTAPYTYQWFHNFNETSDSINNLPPGLYFCSVTDSHGCQDTISQYITQPDSLGLNVNTSEPLCNGNFNGWLAIEAFGGIQPYTYEWDNYITNLDSIHNLGADTYTVTLTDGNNCILVEPIIINEPDELSISFTNVNNISCKDLTDGWVIADISGGTPGYTFDWSEGVNFNDSLAYNLDANVLYNVSVTDSNGCEKQKDITLIEPDKLIISGNVSPVECGVAAGSGELQAQGGTLPYEFEWSNGENSETATELPSGIVNATVTDANNCKDSINFTINHTGSISATTKLIEEIKCFGDTSAIACADIPSGFKPCTFYWYNKDSVLTCCHDTAMNLKAGEYTIYASDKFQCSDTIGIIIHQPDSISPGFIITQPSCSSIPDGQITTSTVGGTFPYFYDWSNGSKNPTIKNITEGLYSLTITDFNNCQSQYDILLTEEEFCVIIHNTITPNGDGKNDVWIIENIEEFPLSEVWIFNRNGRQVFYQQKYENNWDGMYNNEKLPEGTYYYIIDLGDGKDARKGHLTILR